jgi:uncharacterized protein (DUF2267 family)
MEYRQAQLDFDAFITGLRDRAMLQTTHQAFTMLEAVFWVFRRRLDASTAARFADELPPVLRAIFVKGWDPVAEPLPFAGPAEHAAEVLTFRRDHNLSTPTAIADVAATLRERLGEERFARLLAPLTPQARTFWQA